MPKSPEVIIAEFETRRSSAKAARRKRLWQRGFDIAQLAGSLVVFVIVAIQSAPSANKPYTFLIAVLLFSFLSREAQKCWALEDRIAELERASLGRVPPSTCGRE